MLLTSSVLLLSLLVACNNQPNAETATSDNITNKETVTPSSNSSNKEHNLSGELSSVFPSDLLSESISIDSVNNDSSVVRAETQTDKGTLLMISNGIEERGHLLVSSTMGQEGDQTFQSNYSIVYRQGNKDKVLLELPAYLIIRPSDKILSFEKASFKDADVYYLTPQYTSGFGVEGYIFAIDKQSGEAFPLEVIKKDHVSRTILYSEAEALPSVENEQLVVHPPVRAGTPEEDAKTIYYNLDLSNKQLIAE